MAITLNIDSTFGATAPTGGYTNESSRDQQTDLAFVRDESGDKVKLRSKKLITKNVTISGKGSADYSAVTAGAFTADALKVTSGETDEYHDGEYIDFQQDGIIYSNVA